MKYFYLDNRLGPLLPDPELVQTSVSKRTAIVKRWLNLEHDRDVIHAEAQELAEAIESPETSSFSHSFSVDCDSSMSFFDTPNDTPLPICESTMVQDDSHSILYPNPDIFDHTHDAAIQRVVELSRMMLAAARESGNPVLIDITTESINHLQRELENKFYVRQSFE